MKRLWTMSLTLALMLFVLACGIIMTPKPTDMPVVMDTPSLPVREFSIDDPAEGNSPDFRRLTVAYDDNSVTVTVLFDSETDIAETEQAVFLDGTTIHMIRFTARSFQLYKDADADSAFEEIVYSGSVTRASDASIRIQIPAKYIPDISEKKVWAYSMSSRDQIPDREKTELLLWPTAAPCFEIAPFETPAPIPLNTPRVADTSGSASTLSISGQAVVVREPYAYLAVGGRMQIIDVSNPARPVFVGEAINWKHKSKMQNNGGIIATKDRVYVVEERWPNSKRGDDVLGIIDVRDPVSPTILGTYRAPIAVNNALVSDKMAYLAYQGYWKSTVHPESGLLLVDLGDPDHPVELGSYAATPQPTNLAVLNDRIVYVGTRNGVYVLDTRNPAHPVETSHVCEGCWIFKIVVQKTIAYMWEWRWEWQNKLYVFDISDPLRPVLLCFQEMPDIDGAPTVMADLTLFTTDKDDNLCIFDISNPFPIVEIGSFDPPGRVRDIFVSGTLAYLAVDYDGLLIVDVSDPSAPVQLSYYNALGNMPVEEMPTTITDLSDTTPPTGTVEIHGGYAINGAPGTIAEAKVTFVATDTQNTVTNMRLSYDGEEWHEWLPYSTTRKIIVPIPPSWVTFYLYVQYRDAAGNVSEVVVGEQLTEGW